MNANKVAVNKTDFGAHVEIFLAEDIGDKRYTCNLVERVEVKKGYTQKPTMTMGTETAQRLLDELYAAGFRPRNGESSLAHTDALNEHIKDLRKITFKQLKIN